MIPRRESGTGRAKSLWLAAAIILLYALYVVAQTTLAVNWLPSVENWHLTHIAIQTGLIIAMVIVVTHRLGLVAGLIAMSVMWLVLAFHELSYDTHPDTWIMLIGVLVVGIISGWIVNRNAQYIQAKEALVQKQAQTHRLLQENSGILIERVKELHCLNQISQLTNDSHMSVEKLLERTAMLVCDALLFSEFACADIQVEEQHYCTHGWHPANARETFEIKKDKRVYGVLRIGYMPAGSATNQPGDILPEEREMCLNICNHLAQFIDRKEAEAQVAEYSQHLEELVLDRTEQLKATLESETAIREKLQYQMDQKVEFIRAVVHELRTPLTALLAASDLLVPNCQTITSQKLAVQVNKGALNLNKRINELYDLARGEVGMLTLRLQKTVPSSVLEESCNYFSAEAQSKQIALEKEWTDDLGEIPMDSQRIAQVLNNIIQNALEHTTGGGTVTISAVASEDEVVFSVTDTGCGISEDRLAAVFMPYQEVGKNPHGMGLGLSISKMLVELHGGRIWADSRYGKGSTFSFSLPRQNHRIHETC